MIGLGRSVSHSLSHSLSLLTSSSILCILSLRFPVLFLRRSSGRSKTEVLIWSWREDRCCKPFPTVFPFQSATQRGFPVVLALTVLEKSHLERIIELLFLSSRKGKLCPWSRAPAVYLQRGYTSWAVFEREEQFRFYDRNEQFATSLPLLVR